MAFSSFHSSFLINLNILVTFSQHSHKRIVIPCCYCCCSSVVQLCPNLYNLWTAAHQASLSFTNSWSLLKLTSIESVKLSDHFILCYPFFSCFQSFPASRSFPMSWLFASGGQSIRASASVLPMNIQDWFPLGLTV